MEVERLKVVYFSPTGTTRKIIETVSQGINHSIVESVDITNPQGRKRQLCTSEKELLVIGVPVYFGRVQTNAIEWLKTLKAHNTPTVCVVVYGNRHYDDALLELKDLSVERGCIPVACGAFVGEHSFSSTETPIAACRPDGEDLRHAESFGERIRERISSLTSVSDLKDINVPGRFPYIDMAEGKQRLSSIEFLEVDKNCTQCGACAELCPAGAINPANIGFVDAKKCILCHACIRNCPTHARTTKNDLINNVALRLSQSCASRKEPIFFL